jgi:hypothetical protein
VDEAGARAAGMRFVLLDPFGDYGAPESPRIAGMHELAGWVASHFDVVPTRVSGPTPGEDAGAARSPA